MKKLFIVSTLLFVAVLSTQGVFAAEETPTTIDWGAWVSELASVKNFVLTTSGGMVIIASWKALRIFKWLRDPSNEDTVFNFLEKMISRFSKSPEVIIAIGRVVVELPVVKNFIDIVFKWSDSRILDLEEKIINLKAKLGADVFSTSQDKQQALQLLAKLEAEYENIKPSE